MHHLGALEEPRTGISRSTPWASFSVYFLEKHRTAAALGRPSKSICATSYAGALPEPQIIALHLRSGLCPPNYCKYWICVGASAVLGRPWTNTSFNSFPMGPIGFRYWASLQCLAVNTARDAKFW